MGIQEPNNLAYQDALRQLARDMEDAGHGGKGQLVERFGAHWHRTRQTVYRDLKRIGRNSGRKLRADAGSTRVEEAISSALKRCSSYGMRAWPKGRHAISRTTRT